MTSRLRERRSRLATWSARLAFLSIPILIIAAVGHRARLLEATGTYAAMALGFSIAALAVIAAIVAFEGIWRDGRKGAGAALRGLVIGLLVLILPAIGAWRVVTYPRLIDVSTDVDNPPRFRASLRDHGPDEVATFNLGEVEISLQQDAYPDIVSRHYPVSPARVFEEAQAIVERHGWVLLETESPSEEDESGRIEAVAITLLFAFRQDVVIRIVPDGDGTLVDMRSAARNAAHDLGANADRIRGFFDDLDDALHGVSAAA
jgi:hypothetical protein